jgi:hypothetical protein
MSPASHGSDWTSGLVALRDAASCVATNSRCEIPTVPAAWWRWAMTFLNVNHRIVIAKCADEGGGQSNL